MDESKEMSLSEKMSKIDRDGAILLIHLIKQNAKKPSTPSAEVSIKNAARAIHKLNKRRKAGGYYLSEFELLEILEDGYQGVMKKAALEALEGRFNSEELAAMVEKERILEEAIELFSCE